jgi:hypothetical protein
MKHDLKKINYPDDLGYEFPTIYLYFALYYDIHTAIQPIMDSIIYQAMHVDTMIINELKTGNRHKVKDVQKDLVKKVVKYIVKNNVQIRTHEQAFKVANG